MYILIKIHIFCMFGFSGRVCNFSGSGRVGFAIFFSGSGRVRVSKKPSGRVGFSGFRVPDPSLRKSIPNELIIIKTKWPNLYFLPFFSKDKVEISCVDILKKFFYEPPLQQQQKIILFKKSQFFSMSQSFCNCIRIVQFGKRHLAYFNFKISRGFSRAK